MRRKAAVLLYPGCVFFEVALAAEALAGSMQVSFYTPDGESHCCSTGAVISSAGSYKVAEGEVEELGIVLVPGGDPGSIIPESKAGHLLRLARSHDAVICGICAGVLVMASAGLLAGVRMTHNYTAEFASREAVAFTEKYWEGCIYERADVIVDQDMITAKPWAYVEFAAVVALAARAMSPAQASTLVSRYRRIASSTSAQMQAALDSAARIGNSPPRLPHADRTPR